MKIHIATLFDRNYLVKTLAFHDALANRGNYQFWFLCLDEETKRLVEKLALPNVTALGLLELADPELLAARAERSAAEFAFTSKSALIAHILAALPDGEALLYADNDLLYFAPPDELFERMAAHAWSVGVVPHRFAGNKEFLNEKIGRYNAGLIYFIAGAHARRLVSDWRTQCITWCYLRYEPGRFGDQLYMNAWPAKYQGIYEIPDKGINLGSWSLAHFTLREKNGIWFVDDEPLVCYHFHRIRFYLDGAQVKPVPIYVFNEKLYEIYRQRMEKAWRTLAALEGKWTYGLVEKPSFLRREKQIIHRTLRNWYTGTS